MGNLRISEWRSLPTSLAELCINTTLRCGQSFRWRKSGPDEWSCALHGRILTLRQDSTHLHYRVVFPSTASTETRTQAPLTPPPSSPSSTVSASGPADDDTSQLLRHYLNLKPNLSNLYAEWSAADPNFRRRAPGFNGIRILRQDPWEALCGFICSSNNNISRISQMMHKLCLHYGPLIGHLEHRHVEPGKDVAENNLGMGTGSIEMVPYHDFPTPEMLTGPGVEAQLRDLGFGYRAKYIHQTACMVVNEKGGLQWLESLVNPEALQDGQRGKNRNEAKIPPGGREGYRAAHESLLELQGVGPKVADCVCLMGLGWSEAVPVDTHVWQIAQRDYNFRAKGAGKAGISTLNKVTYDAVGDKFRSLWGKEAGWAHSVLFTADLRAFAPTKPSSSSHVKSDIDIQVKQETGPPGKLKVTSITSETKSSKRPMFDDQPEKPVNVGVHENEPELVASDMMSRIKRRRRTR